MLNNDVDFTHIGTLNHNELANIFIKLTCQGLRKCRKTIVQIL